MLEPIILDTDGSLDFFRRDIKRIYLRDLQASLQYWADQEAIRRFQAKLLQEASPAGFCRFLGSGDFHHLTLATLEKLTDPFALLVFDNHPDCSYALPRYACGNWLYHAVKLPLCRQVVHVGATETYGWLRRALSLHSLQQSGKLLFIPAEIGKGKKYYCQEIMTLLEPSLKEEMPLYLSLDKDVINAQESPGDWDNGILTLTDVVYLIEAVGSSFSYIGADITGEASFPCNYQGYFLKHLLADWDHPNPCDKLSLTASWQKQEKVNTILLSLLAKGADGDTAGGNE
ncbi:MAG: arginase family protein [Sporomusaceae bacterium]|nr:arginase family protein [Sporomusaceae bacterium]